MKNSSLRASTLRDVAIFLLLSFMFAQVICVVLAPSGAETTYVVLTVVVFLAAMVGMLGWPQLALVLMGTLTCVWVGYKLYDVYVFGTQLALSDYLFIPVPLLVAASVGLYYYAASRMEGENIMLRKQVEDLVLVDELTGLYNARALYREIPGMVHYCARHSLPISLMIVELRYGQELRSMLTRRRYREMIQRLAEIVSDTVRTEDKVYCIDDKGSLAILLTTDKAGLQPVRARIRNAVAAADAFKGILDANVEVSLRIAGKQYEDGLDPMAFKKSAESELAYDV